jgi:hypothetical protein
MRKPTWISDLVKWFAAEQYRGSAHFSRLAISRMGLMKWMGLMHPAVTADLCAADLIIGDPF